MRRRDLADSSRRASDDDTLTFKEHLVSSPLEGLRRIRPRAPGPLESAPVTQGMGDASGACHRLVDLYGKIHPAPVHPSRSTRSCRVRYRHPSSSTRSAEYGGRSELDRALQRTKTKVGGQASNMVAAFSPMIRRWASSGAGRVAPRSRPVSRRPRRAGCSGDCRYSDLASDWSGGADVSTSGRRVPVIRCCTGTRSWPTWLSGRTAGGRPSSILSSIAQLARSGRCSHRRLKVIVSDSGPPSIAAADASRAASSCGVVDLCVSTAIASHISVRASA